MQQEVKELGTADRPDDSDVGCIRNSDLFDADWYLAQYQDVTILSMDPAEHYLRIGWKLNRNPSPKFSSAAYLAAHADVAKAGINPLLHYIHFGKREKRSLGSASSPTGGQSPVTPGRDIGRPASRPATATQQQSKPAAAASSGSLASASKPEAGVPQPHAQAPQTTKQPVGKATEKPSALSKEYEVIKAAFDHAYYLRRYPDIANARIDPVKHYIENGAREGRDPSPEFVTKYYVNRYPDVAQSGLNPFYHWLTVGKAEGRGATSFSAGEPNFDTLCEMLGRPPKEVEQDLIARRRDLRRRLESGVLGEMVKKAGELEPLIHQSWRVAMTPRMAPFHSDAVIAQVAAIRHLHNSVGHRTAKAIVAIRTSGVSGAARLAGRLANALSEIFSPEDVVIIRTDQSELLIPEWFPSECRNVDFAAAVQKLQASDRQRVLIEFIRSLRPNAVFNLNSRLFWDAMLPYGKALSRSVKLFAYMFCNEKDIYGNWVGYPNKYFYRYFDIYQSILTDCHWLAAELGSRFMIPHEMHNKLLVLDTPINDPLSIQAMPDVSQERRPQVFWSGRFDRQKRVDIVAEIARGLPNVDFRLWGEPVLDQDFEKLKLPKNLRIEGVYKRFAELPFNECDLWLYTSEWDGVPNVLLEVVTTGIPIVGSLSGGCGEVLIEGLCERISNVEDVVEFQSAIRRVLNNPRMARDRAARLRAQILNQRSSFAYRKSIEVLLFGDKPA